jgi:purine nucleosidase
MVGLDATLQARADERVKARLAGLGRLGRDLLLPALGGYLGADDTTPPQLIPAVLAPGAGSGPAVHDVCALALVAEPALFGGQPARVEVETAGRWTAGMTVTEFGAAAGVHNALVVTSIEVAGFWDAVIAAWARVPAAQPAG